MSDFEQWVTTPLLKQELSFETEQPSDRVYDVLSKNHLLKLRQDEKMLLDFIDQLQAEELISYITEINTALGGHYYREPVVGLDAQHLERALEIAAQITNRAGKAKFLANLIEYNDFFSSDNRLTGRIFGAIIDDERITQQSLRELSSQESETAAHSLMAKNFLQRELAKQVLDQEIFDLAQNIQLADTKNKQFFDLPALAWTQFISQQMDLRPQLLETIEALPAQETYLTSVDSNKQVMVIDLKKADLTEDDFSEVSVIANQLKNRRLELFCDIYQNPAAHQLTSNSGQIELKQLFS